MISDDAPSFIENFIEAMSESLKKASPITKLSASQKAWFKFCLTCILQFHQMLELLQDEFWKIQNFGTVLDIEA